MSKWTWVVSDLDASRPSASALSPGAGKSWKTPLRGFPQFLIICGFLGLEPCGISELNVLGSCLSDASVTSWEPTVGFHSSLLREQLQVLTYLWFVGGHAGMGFMMRFCPSSSCLLLWGLCLLGPMCVCACPVVSDSLRPHGLQHAGPPCPSPTPGAHQNSCPLSRWCRPTISSSVVPFSSCLQSSPASGLFHMGQVFASGGQSIGVSASTSVLPMNTQDWSPSGWTGWISLQSKGLSRVFSNTTVQKHQFFSAQLSL